ncbi:hypothetical protein HY032_00570 [Candidatus Gottesmanbacteria bacterium]|nr:hypothetical protein [Candidatus Gottesmanbacteria bacterium]
MRIQPSLGSVVGVSDDAHWGQVFLSPDAYGVVEVEDPRGRARDWGVRVLARLSEETASPPKSLKATQEIAIKSMEERVVSLILLVPVGAILYVVLLGEGRISLKRGDHLAILMDQPGAISGEVQEGDTLILMTRMVARALTHSETNVLFDHSEAPLVAEKMTLAIHTHQDGAGGAALIIHVKGLTPVEGEVPLVPHTRVHTAGSLFRGRGQRVWQSIGHVHRRLPALWHRPMVPITALLILLFVVSVTLWIRKQVGQKVHSDVARVLTDAQHAFDEGVALLELNPVKGRERLTVARDGLMPLQESLSPSSLEGKSVAKLYKDVVDQLTIAMQVHRAQPALFYDFSLLKIAASISSLGQDRETMVLLDGRGLTVATLAIPTKKGEIVAGGESYRGARLVTLHGDSVYVLVEDGIRRASVQGGKTTALVVKKPAQWGSIISLVSFGGNLYLLDSGTSRIWKYIATDVGFSETREYLNPDTLPDLSRATGMAADGGVWVGTREGKIFHFIQGQEQTFAPRGVDPPLGKTLVVATSEGDKNLYVLDSDNKRVVVTDKDGVYLSQYVWSGALAPTQLAVSEKLKLIVLLSDGKLYSVELK